jgi:hypothetical protein
LVSKRRIASLAGENPIKKDFNPIQSPLLIKSAQKRSPNFKENSCIHALVHT